MNTTLKHWKEAATLIIAAGHRLSAESLPSRTPLVVPSHLRPSSNFDYDVLLLKRSAKSGFMPNAYVFPGGMLDSSDFSSDWLDVFRSFSNFPNFGLRRVKQPIETRPPIFATDRLKLGSSLPGEVALRICALRETFEESGVLLIVPRSEEEVLLKSLNDVSSNKLQQQQTLCSKELSKWRTLVNQNPSNFVKMCKELAVLPNIWALHEWSNWLTPPGRYGAMRFDTAFFLCCLREIPPTLQDEKEIVRFEWSKPSDILQSYQAQQIWIAPPQYYELGRLCCLPHLQDLHNFACQRAVEGCEQWLPVVFPEDGQYISLLPGDKQYPADGSEPPEGVERLERPEDPQDQSELHRILIRGPYSTTVKMTVKPKYNHLVPVTELALTQDTESHV